MSGAQIPERYLLPEAVGSIVPGRVAELIHRKTDLSRLRTDWRGTDAEVDAVLMALHIAALKWRSSVSGTNPTQVAEPVACSEWLTTQEASEMLDITPRAVTKAISDKRLPAERAGRAWRIHRDDVEHHLAARDAA